MAGELQRLYEKRGGRLKKGSTPRTLALAAVGWTGEFESVGKGEKISRRKNNNEVLPISLKLQSSLTAPAYAIE